MANARMQELVTELNNTTNRVKEIQKALDAMGWDASPDGTYQAVYGKSFPNRRFHLAAVQAATMLVGREIADDNGIVKSGDWLTKTTALCDDGAKANANVRNAISYLDRARIIEQAPSVGGREIRYQLTDAYQAVCGALDRDITTHDLRPFSKADSVNLDALLELVSDDFEPVSVEDATDVLPESNDGEAMTVTADDIGTLTVEEEEEEEEEEDEPTPEPASRKNRRARANLI